MTPGSSKRISHTSLTALMHILTYIDHICLGLMGCTSRTPPNSFSLSSIPHLIACYYTCKTYIGLNLLYYIAGSHLNNSNSSHSPANILANIPSIKLNWNSLCIHAYKDSKTHFLSNIDKYIKGTSRDLRDHTCHIRFYILPVRYRRIYIRFEEKCTRRICCTYNRISDNSSIFEFSDPYKNTKVSNMCMFGLDSQGMHYIPHHNYRIVWCSLCSAHINFAVYNNTKSFWHQHKYN